MNTASVLPLSPSGTLTPGVIDSSATSSSTIVPVPVPADPSPAFAAPLSVTVNVSSASGVRSPCTATRIVRSVSPGANVSVPPLSA